MRIKKLGIAAAVVLGIGLATVSASPAAAYTEAYTFAGVGHRHPQQRQRRPVALPGRVDPRVQLAAAREDRQRLVAGGHLRRAATAARLRLGAFSLHDHEKVARINRTSP
jgi:hypothetical protein